jgi:hypothetical protein
VNIEKKCYLLVSWDLDSILRSGKSPYVKVNLRRNGLKETPIRINISDYHEVIDLRISNPKTFWKMIYEVVDKQKFFLARIKLGF